MNTQDHERIYLQPPCCADGNGRMWCEHDAPEECEEGAPWTEYVRADLVATKEGSPKLPQDADEFIQNYSEWAEPLDDDIIYTEHFREWMSGHVRVPVELIEAVAHQGVDFGYGEFKLDSRHIAQARALLSASKEE